MNHPNKHHLQVSTPKDTEIHMSRVFDAPRELLFAAWTQPEHLKRWMSTDGMILSTCEVDLRVGGKWRWVMEDEEDNDYASHGEYREIVPPERLVYTDGFEGMPDAPTALITIVFEDIGNKQSRVTSISAYESKAERDAILKMGVEEGVSQTYQRLDTLLAELV